MAVVVRSRCEVPMGALHPCPEQFCCRRISRPSPDVSQRHLAYPHPGVQDPGVLEGVRDQPQTGGVPQTEVSTPAILEADSRVASEHPGAVFDHVVSEFTEHPGGSELGPVRHPERVVVRIVGERPHPELAVGVEGRASHDVAGIADVFGIGLVTCSQRLNQVPEEPHAPVSPGQRKDPRIQAALLLGGDLGPQGLKEFGVDIAFDEHGGHLPSIRDHPIGVGRLVDRGGEGHEAEPVGARVHPVYRLSTPLGIEVLVYETGCPSIGHSTSEHRATEAVAGQAGRPQHLGPHDHLCRAQCCGPGIQLRLKQVRDPDGSGHHRVCHREKLWCTAEG